MFAMIVFSDKGFKGSGMDTIDNFDSAWRSDFSFFTQSSSEETAYLDSAATSQVPAVVLDSVAEFDRHQRASVHRGVYPLSESATIAFEQARDQVAAFLSAKRRESIVFTHGCTEALNLVCESYLAPQVVPGDEIIVTTMDHHANLVPWLDLAKRQGLVIKVMPISDEGELLWSNLESMITPQTKLLTLPHVSNVLGTINPVKSITQMAKAMGVSVCVDGAQAATHLPIDVHDLDVDFYVLSGHKMFAPFGVGALYINPDRWEACRPYQKGGGMIESVSFEEVTYAPMPSMMEAGTPNISAVLGLGQACAYISQWDWAKVAQQDKQLQQGLNDILSQVPGLTIIGQAKEKIAIASFVCEGIHAHDMATILGSQGVCVRAGHHCAMPLMKRYGVVATTRASCLMYNNSQDLRKLSEGLDRARSLFHG